uniref:Uncharacterized protein n=1 Tax=Dulem virus 42 TaxID=3145760 RepID=A0AAU8B980_9CAUD
MRGDDLDADVKHLDDEINRKSQTEVNKKAAWKIIKENIDKAKRRSLIARRHFAEEMGVSEETLEQDQTETEESINQEQ